MAPKLGASGLLVNSGPIVGVNTSDRNSTEDEAVLEAMSNSKAGTLRLGQSLSANGSQSNGGPTADDSNAGMEDRNGNEEEEGSSMMMSQLETDIRSLHLTAPGTTRDDKAESTSEDDESTDSVEQSNKRGSEGNICH